MKRTLVLIVTLILLMPVCLAQTGVYRAVSIGISNYDDGRQRVGGANSAQGVYDALSRSFGSRGSFISVLYADLTKAQLLGAISSALEDAEEGDVSLIYISACWAASRG